MRAGTAWMPLYIGDYLGDTMRLSTLQHGAYLLLLMECWRQGHVPTEPKALAAITKLTLRAWQAEASEALLPMFYLHDDGSYHQKRVDQERAKAGLISAKRREAARTRHSKPDANEVQTRSKPDANAEQMHEDSRASALQSQSPSSFLRSEDTPALRSGASNGNQAAKDDLWSSGLAVLHHLTGRPVSACRQLVGRMVKGADGDCSVVLAAIHRAEAERPGDTVPWITAAIAASRRNHEGRIAEDWDLPNFNQAALDAMGDA